MLCKYVMVIEFIDGDPSCEHQYDAIHSDMVKYQKS